MPRTSNFYYQDPTAGIADSLVRAFFGDPQRAQEQEQAKAQIALREAQRKQAEAAAGLDISKTKGVDTQNAASLTLPDLFAKLMPPPVDPANPPITTVSDPRFLSDMGQPMPVAPDPNATFRDNLPALIAAMSQVQGDKIDTGETIGTLASFLGGDEMARRGMVAQGQTPGKEFALTPDRADAIATAGYGADLNKATSVATINHANDIPVANIRRASAFDVAGVNNRDDIPVANIKAAGPAPGFDAITRAIPGATMNSGLRTPEHNQGVGGASNSYHLGTHPGAQAYDIPPQKRMTVEQAAARIMTANPGVMVVEALNEGDHWHFALQSTGKPGKAAAAKAPRAINSAGLKILDGKNVDGEHQPGEIETWLTANGFASDPKSPEGRKVKAALRSRAITIYQQTGNPVQAVADAAAELKIFSRSKRAAAAPKAATGGAPKLSTDAAANAFVSNLKNKGKTFVGPDGKTRRVP